MYGIVMKGREAIKMRLTSTIHDQSKASTLRRSRLRNRIHIFADKLDVLVVLLHKRTIYQGSQNNCKMGRLEIVVTQNPGFRIFRLQNFRTQLPRHRNSTITVPLTL